MYWHEDCLKCGCCDCRLGEVGHSLYTKGNLILCKRDYLRLFGSTGYCAACNKVIYCTLQYTVVHCSTVVVHFITLFTAVNCIYFTLQYTVHTTHCSTLYIFVGNDVSYFLKGIFQRATSRLGLLSRRRLLKGAKCCGYDRPGRSSAAARTDLGGCCLKK